MILVSATASAQYRPNPFFFNFKGVKADSVFVLPRDTAMHNAPLEPDSGRMAFKNGALWLQTGTSWFRIDTWKSLTGYVAADILTIGSDGYNYFQSPTLVNKTIISFETESTIYYQVPNLSDVNANLSIPGRGQSFYYDPSLGRIIFPWFYDEGTGLGTTNVRVIYR